MGSRSVFAIDTLNRGQLRFGFTRKSVNGYTKSLPEPDLDDGLPPNLRSINEVPIRYAKVVPSDLASTVILSFQVVSWPRPSLKLEALCAALSVLLGLSGLNCWHGCQLR